MICLFYSLAVVAALYALFDLNYFIRIVFTFIWRKLIPRRRKSVTDEINIYGFCTTNDVDLFMTHMNNARFMRELDFARFVFFDRTGICNAVMKQRGCILQGAATIRYRRPLPIFTFYKVTTKLVYWDDKAVYLEHRFITASDNFIRAVGSSKQNLTGLKTTVPELLKAIAPEIRRPEPEEDLKLWLTYIDKSSEKLKKRD